MARDTRPAATGAVRDFKFIGRGMRGCNGFVANFLGNKKILAPRRRFAILKHPTYLQIDLKFGHRAARQEQTTTSPPLRGGEGARDARFKKSFLQSMERHVHL